jgi:hypothetical protein
LKSVEMGCSHRGQEGLDLGPSTEECCIGRKQREGIQVVRHQNLEAQQQVQQVAVSEGDLQSMRKRELEPGQEVQRHQS